MCDSSEPNKESRRADSNRLPLLQLRVITRALQGYARGCKSRIDKPVSFLSFARCCTVLRSRWYQKATDDASRPLYDERSFFTFTVPGERGEASSLDGYSHWIPTMGRHATEGMDEALG
jgi:hypothetical protein